MGTDLCFTFPFDPLKSPQRAKSSLSELVVPATQWIQRMTNALLYPMEKQLQQKAAAAAVVPNESDTIANAVGQSPNHTVTNGSVTQLSAVTATIETNLINQPATVPLPFNNVAEMKQVDRLADAGEQIRTVNTLSPQSTGQVGQQMFSEKERYFTFEGQHRKFYLAARYLRSTQRQRRHRRRVAKKVKEREHHETCHQRNVLSYGGHTRLIWQQNIASLTEVKDTDTQVNAVLDDLSLTSTTSTGDSIQLVCWKDIDMDLEVRSIDDGKELVDLISKGFIEEYELNTPTNISNPRRSFREFDEGNVNQTKRLAEKHQKVREKPVYAAKGTTGNRISGKSMQMKFKENIAVNHLQCTLPTEATYKIGVPRYQNKPTVFQDLHTDNSPTVFCNATAIALEKHELVNSSPLSLPYTAHSKKAGQLFNDHHGKLRNSETFSKFQSRNPLPDSGDPRSNTCLTDMSEWHLPMGHMRNSCSFQQERSTRSLLQSTVISNPVALDRKLYETWAGRRENLGKSRLSMASSLGELNSDILVQLSYYSQQASSRGEEDLSFFSYRDGFSSSEDLSKITVPISLSLLIMLTYILIGAMVFSTWEERDYMKWSYFCFITLSTIGFGDIVPGTKIDSENPSEKLIIISLYVAIGLSVFAMCFKLMQEEVVDKMKWLAFKIGILKNKQQVQHAKEKSEKSL